MKGAIHTQSPAISVSFLGHANGEAAVAGFKGEVSKDVLSLQVRLTRAPAEGGASGFGMTLVPRREYLTQIVPGDWVSISLGNAGSAGTRLLVGQVDAVSEQERVSMNGTAERSVSIVGRDWSKCLTNTEMVFDRDLAAIERGYLTMTATKWMNDNKGAFLSPSDFIKYLMPLYLGGNLPNKTSVNNIRQFLYPEGSTPVTTGSKLDLAGIEPTQGGAPVDVYGLDMTLISMLRYLSHPVLNEFWFETNPSGASPFRVVMRQYPYDKDAFTKLDSAAVAESEVVNLMRSATSQEVYNFFKLRTSSGLGATDDLMNAARIGVFLKNSINVFGLRRREEITPFAAFSQAGGAAATGDSLRTTRMSKETTDMLVERWTKLLVNWHWQNDKLLSGSMITRFRPDIRPGRRLVYSDNYGHGGGFSAYIDNVTHTFNYPGPSTTSITFSRGVSSVDKLLSYEQLEGPAGATLLKKMPLVASAGTTASSGSGGYEGTMSGGGGPETDGDDFANLTINIKTVFSSATVSYINIADTANKYTKSWRSPFATRYFIRVPKGAGRVVALDSNNVVTKIRDVNVSGDTSVDL